MLPSVATTGRACRPSTNSGSSISAARARGALKDDNIFDIQTAVAIGVGVRTGRPQGDDCNVRYLRITGTRAEKLDRLKQASLVEASEDVPGTGLDRLTPNQRQRLLQLARDIRPVPVDPLRLQGRTNMAHSRRPDHAGAPMARFDSQGQRAT